MKVLIIPAEEGCNKIDLFCIPYTTSENFLIIYWLIDWSIYIPCVFYQNRFFYQQTEFSVSLNPPVVWMFFGQMSV